MHSPSSMPSSASEKRNVQPSRCVAVLVLRSTDQRERQPRFGWLVMGRPDRGRARSGLQVLSEVGIEGDADIAQVDDREVAARVAFADLDLGEGHEGETADLALLRAGASVVAKGGLDEVVDGFAGLGGGYEPRATVPFGIVEVVVGGGGEGVQCVLHGCLTAPDPRGAGDWSAPTISYFMHIDPHVKLNQVFSC